jgi:hypothetical protein
MPPCLSPSLCMCVRGCLHLSDVCMCACAQLVPVIQEILAAVFVDGEQKRVDVAGQVRAFSPFFPLPRAQKRGTVCEFLYVHMCVVRWLRPYCHACRHTETDTRARGRLLLSLFICACTRPGGDANMALIRTQTSCARVDGGRHDGRWRSGAGCGACSRQTRRSLF